MVWFCWVWMDTCICQNTVWRACSHAVRNVSHVSFHIHGLSQYQYIICGLSEGNRIIMIILWYPLASNVQFYVIVHGVYTTDAQCCFLSYLCTYVEPSFWSLNGILNVLRTNVINCSVLNMLSIFYSFVPLVDLQTNKYLCND